MHPGAGQRGRRRAHPVAPAADQIIVSDTLDSHDVLLPPAPVEWAASVVIPVGRVDAHLAEQLVALAGQRQADDWEVVLSLNTADPDQRAALEHLIADHPRCRIVDSSDSAGASHARNVGARAARSSRLVFCDADDIAAPGWLDAMLRALGEHVAVGGHLDEARLAVPGQEGWRPPATPDRLPAFLGHPYLVSANLGIHRHAFELVGGFDETLTRGEDMVISFDLARAGVDLAYAGDAVIHYRHRAGLLPMLRQHYLYGIGMSEVVRRGRLPGGAIGGVRALRPSGTPVEHRSWVNAARRAAIAAGRVVGLARELQRR
jgi:glycosyltransferase involved in cell wall biosynthesis